MKQHELLKEYVSSLVNGNTNSLVVVGQGGIGKSHSIIEQLNDMGLERDRHWMLISGFTTPLQMFNLLGKARTLEGPKLLFFDDLDSILANKTCIALLKAALWDVDGRRVISYHSSTSKLEGPRDLEFEGKVLLVVNDLRYAKHFGKPLLDRGILYNMEMDGGDVIEYIEEILPNVDSGVSLEERYRVWERIKKFADNPNFSLRSLIRALEFYHTDPANWFTLYVNTLELSREQKAYYTVREMGLKTKAEEAAHFAKLTKKSTRAYYRVNES